MFSTALKLKSHSGMWEPSLSPRTLPPCRLPYTALTPPPPRIVSGGRGRRTGDVFWVLLGPTPPPPSPARSSGQSPRQTPTQMADHWWSQWCDTDPDLGSAHQCVRPRHSGSYQGRVKTQPGGEWRRTRRCSDKTCSLWHMSCVLNREVQHKLRPLRGDPTDPGHRVLPSSSLAERCQRGTGCGQPSG